MPFYLASTIGNKVYVLVRSSIDGDDRLLMVNSQDTDSSKDWIPLFASGSQSSGIFMSYYMGPNGYSTTLPLNPSLANTNYVSYRMSTPSGQYIAVSVTTRGTVMITPTYNIPNIMATGVDYTLQTPSGKPITFNIYESMSTIRAYTVLSPSTSVFRVIPFVAYSNPNCSSSLNNIDLLALEQSWATKSVPVPNTFVTQQQCTSNYLYDYCEGQNTCSSVCYGVCNSTLHNQICVVSGPQNITCKGNDGPSGINEELIIGVIIVIVIVFFIVCFFVSRSSHQQHPTVSSLQDLSYDTNVDWGVY